MNPRLPVLIHEEAAIRRAVPLDLALIDHIGAVLAQASRGGFAMPPVMQVLAEGGQTCAKGAWIAGYDRFAVKLSSIYPPTPGASQSEPNGLMCVLESATGRVRAVLLDNGYLTETRTAAAGALAARTLAAKGARRLGIVGSGKQALAQAEAIAAAMALDHISVWARDTGRAAAAAEHIAERTGVWVSVAASIAALVADSDIAVTTTTAREPVLGAEVLRPGLLVIAMGSDTPGKRELDPALVRGCDLYVADNFDQCARLGELQGLDRETLRRTAELGPVLAGLAAGRTSESECIVADLTGLGLQDTAIALFAMDRLGAGAEEGTAEK